VSLYTTTEKGAYDEQDFDRRSFILKLTAAAAGLGVLKAFHPPALLGQPIDGDWQPGQEKDSGSPRQEITGKYTIPLTSRRGCIAPYFIRFIRRVSTTPTATGIGDLRGITEKLDYIKSLGSRCNLGQSVFPVSLLRRRLRHFRLLQKLLHGGVTCNEIEEDPKASLCASSKRFFASSFVPLPAEQLCSSRKCRSRRRKRETGKRIDPDLQRLQDFLM